MKIINKDKAVQVDFNNADKDHAIRLHLPVTQKDIVDLSLVLNNGENILMTDGEIELVGTLLFRDGIWVAIPVNGTFKNIDT